MQPILAVVMYPKKFSFMEEPELHCFAKVTSNRKVMTAYYQEQLARHGTTHHVRLVKRDDVQQMRAMWRMSVEAHKRNLLRACEQGAI